MKGLAYLLVRTTHWQN